MAIPKHGRLEFKRLREQALDLLEWSLHDLSPALDLKMGIEREGHFISPHLKKPSADFAPASYRIKCDRAGMDLADAMAAHLAASHPQLPVRCIYRENAGSYLVELTTHPLAPKQAAHATEAIGRAMMDYARDAGTRIEDMGFGTIAADWMKQWGKNLTSKLPLFTGEFFPAGDSLVLAGRGQHANISLWCGNQNMFAASPYVIGKQQLGSAVVQEAIRMLPGMILPSRHGNYHRIANDSSGGLKKIAADYDVLGSERALNWRISEMAEEKKEYVRLEFRQAASDAEPLDVALAAAIPTTKTCLECAQKDSGGKAVFKNGMPSFDFTGYRESELSYMPSSEKAAAELFNKADNPNFVFLDELAAAKIAKLEKHWRQTGLSGDRAIYEQARHDLENLGTRLHDGYCRQYGLESKMAALLSASPAHRGVF